jgi:hypothetical protein
VGIIYGKGIIFELNITEGMTMSRCSEGALAASRHSRFVECLSWLGLSPACNPRSRRPEQPRAGAESSIRDCADLDSCADLGWLSLCDDAGGHSPHADEVTSLGVTPDDFDVHDANGGDLSWISLSR